MSFSSPSAPKSPVERYYEWNSKKKAFIWYDKENKKEVELSLPAHLIVLDETASVTGYSEKYQSGFTSNEISPYDLKKTPFRIRTFGKDNLGNYSYDRTELWSDFKEILPNGAKFTKNLYVLSLDKSNGNKCICVKFPGGAISPLADLESKGFSQKKHIIVLKDESQHKTKGKVEYNVPVLDMVDMYEAYVEEAIEMDEKLQSYFEEKNGESKDKAVS